jgi:hypothetical protein
VAAQQNTVDRLLPRQPRRKIHGPDHEPAAIIAERNLVMVHGLYSGVTDKPLLSVDIFQFRFQFRDGQTRARLGELAAKPTPDG